MVIPVTQMIDIMKQGMQQTISQMAAETLDELLKEDAESKRRIFSVKENEKILDLKNRIGNLLAVETIPEAIRAEYKDSPDGGDRFIIAGGCFTSILQDSKPNDYDLFILGYSHDQLNYENNSIQIELNTIADIDPSRFAIFDHAGYERNPNILKTFLDKKTRIQYIFTSYKTRKELVDHFDFVHCCISFDIGKNKLYLSKETYDLNMHKVLKKNPTSEKIHQDRINKYVNRGWTRYYEAGTL